MLPAPTVPWSGSRAGEGLGLSLASGVGSGRTPNLTQVPARALRPPSVPAGPHEASFDRAPEIALRRTATNLQFRVPSTILRSLPVPRLWFRPCGPDHRRSGFSLRLAARIDSPVPIGLAAFLSRSGVSLEPCGRAGYPSENFCPALLPSSPLRIAVPHPKALVPLNE